MDSENEYLFHSSDLPSRSFSFFEDKKGEFCDITFKVGERSISAHRIILSAAVPYFYKMFSDKQILDSEEKVMTFPDMNLVALESLIEFAYTGKVKINMENVKMLITAACFLEIDEVRKACCRFLAERLHPENVLNIRDYTCDLQCSELLEDIDCYIRENFEAVSLTNDFLNIPVSLLNELTGRDDLKVKSEEKVFEAVMKWIKLYPIERQKNLPNLLKNVRLPLVKPSYMRNHAVNEELIRTSIECRDLLDEATYYHLVPEERKEYCSFSTTPRSCIINGRERREGNISSIYILYSEAKHTLECFDSAKEKWHTIISQDFVLDYKHTVAELNKKMYCFFPELTYVYDLAENTFFSREGMNLPRTWAGSVSCGNKLYVCGGCVVDAGISSQTNAVECFDPSTEEWTEIASMITCRGAPGVASCAEFIYVLGGRFTDSSFLDSAERCNLKTGTWSVVSPMLAKRCAFGCAALNEKIYVCGGLQPNMILTSTAEVYDPGVNEWKYISSMNKARKRCKLISYCNKLYILGGNDSKGNLSTVEIYEPEEDKWKHGQSTNENLIIVGAAVVPLPSTH